MLHDFFQSLIFSPLKALLFVIFIWGICYISLVRLIKPKQSFWNKLEYVWVIIGLFGALALIDENNKLYSTNELTRVQSYIENDYKFLNKFVSDEFRCMKYSKSDLVTEAEFLKGQNRADSICKWSKQVSYILDSLYKKNMSKIETLPSLNIEDYEKEYVYLRVIADKNLINKSIIKREELKTEINNRDWFNFKNSIGIILLLVAFSLRLTVISNKIRGDKNKLSKS